jgi:hypothetical protein
MINHDLPAVPLQFLCEVLLQSECILQQILPMNHYTIEYSSNSDAGP